MLDDETVKRLLIEEREQVMDDLDFARELGRNDVIVRLSAKLRELTKEINK